ncbi:chaperonin 10-like protein [Mucor mucedo]|uniref:chaperonin 10-like protein n=1 Tax=Mucor mucedo TaxID=29922 RepID=UPI00221F9DC2|nr:chaperonin 10-like protein [Mucor mucedo]KAI7868370.1 chaperonin 10-like protein [Mucor mucedo]
MSAENTTTAWAGVANGKPLTKMELTLKQWDDDSVNLDVTHCGICGSDVHTLDEGWGPTDFPCVVGHEIAGVVTKVGKNVTNVKVGDRAGVGAQSGACHKCEMCLDGQENVCQGGIVYTYSSKWPSGDKSLGGYADKWRGDYRFVFKIPDNLTNETAATFFCAGITTFAPLSRANIIPGKSVVGIMGIGGLGHFGVQFAKGMGAKVVAISQSERKRDVAKELGCDDYINAQNKEDMEKHDSTLTHILCTGNGPDFQWRTYFALMKPNGHFINVSAPDWDFPGMNAFDLLLKQIHISGSGIGSPKEMEKMLQFAADKNIKPWIQKYKMDDVNQAIKDFRAGKPRFRYVLVN